MFQNNNNKRKRDSDSKKSNNKKSTKKVKIANRIQSIPTNPVVSVPQKLSSLQEQFQKKLEGARFRTINESLYTTNGHESFLEFQKNPTMFALYHQGFREQASSWPENPLHKIITWVEERHPSAVIADMGCGDAELAASVKNKVFSFDMVAVNDRVKACDMAHVPLKDESVDIVVFCLSLMGVNIGDFIQEAYRILKVDGILKVAEVRSRFDDNSGTGIKKFCKFLKRAGFNPAVSEASGSGSHQSSSSDGKKGSSDGKKAGPVQNKMFFDVECIKSDRTCCIDKEFAAKPCVYKKR